MKKYQVKPVVYGHIIYQKKKEEISLGCEILYSNPTPPKDFSFLIIYTEIPRKLLKVLLLKLVQPIYKIDAPATRHTWSISFGLFELGKKEGSKEIIGTSWDAKFQKPKEQVLHCPVVHSNSSCWLVSLYFLFQLYLWKSLEIPKPCTKCHSISKIISLKET